MVTPATPQDVEPQISYLDEADPDVDAGLPAPPDDAPPETPVATAAEAAPTDSAAPAPVAEAPEPTPEESPAPPSAPPVDQKAVEELQRMRNAESQRQWQEQVGRQARDYQQRLADAGYLPEQAREQARTYIQQEQRIRSQEQQSAEAVGFVQGRQAAAVHFLQKHGLANKQAMDDLALLQRLGSPEEMEREAKRMKEHRELRAENARLKQGQVTAQTFDNSQGAAEATSNADRLLEAYNNGDRSEQAVRAARRMAFGA